MEQGPFLNERTGSEPSLLGLLVATWVSVQGDSPEFQAGLSSQWQVCFCSVCKALGVQALESQVLTLLVNVTYPNSPLQSITFAPG